MAMETAAPGAQVVGNAFVEQYYHILHHSPDMVHKFYQDSSVLSRQDPDGVMTTVTTMQNIHEKMLSLDYKNYKAEIKTADAQESYKDGVIVLVTGCLTGKDKLKRKFTQTFFLAPQDKGYFVLNDVFRYVEEENEPINTTLETFNDVEVEVSSTITPDPEPVAVTVAHVVDTPAVDVAASHAKEVQNGEQVEIEREIVVVEVVPESQEKNLNSPITEPVSQEDAPKKSYASIVSSLTRKGPTRSYGPSSNPPKMAPEKIEKKLIPSVTESSPALPTPPPNAIITDSNKDAQDEVEGHSIHVRNLPLNATVTQLEDVFKKFGSIKKGGIQVRSNTLQGFCFGFVEFEELSSMQSAIQASPVTIGDRPAVVEIKKTTTRVGGSRGRYTSDRGGRFWNESYRGGRGGGGRGYVRNDFGGRTGGGGGDFSGRGRGPQGGGRGGENSNNYQQQGGRGGGGGEGNNYQQVRGGRGGGRRGGGGVTNHNPVLA